MKQLFCDCKTDEEKSNFFLSGRAVESGVIAPALVNDVAMAYHRCAEFKKETDTLRAKIERMEQPAPSVPREAIEKMLTQLMDIAVSNGANSVSMPDEYVEVAAWLCGIPTQPQSSVNEGVRKVTLGFRWESEAQHHIPTIEIEFDPVSPDSPNDAKSWQDRDRLAAMLSPEAKS